MRSFKTEGSKARDNGNGFPWQHPDPDERSAVFAIGTYSEDVIESNAEEHFGPKYGDPVDRALALQQGLVNDKGEITEKGWALLNQDVAHLERNSVRWMKRSFNSARDEGHGGDSDDLVGTFWYNPTDLRQAALIETGTSERIDMTDASYGDLSRTVWENVSDFGASVLGGAVSFFDVNTKEIEETLDKARAAQKKPKKKAGKAPRKGAKR